MIPNADEMTGNHFTCRQTLNNNCAFLRKIVAIYYEGKS